MPYITREERFQIDPVLYSLTKFLKNESVSVGQMNYILTKLICAWLPMTSYHNIVLVTGILENVKQEYYRKVAGPYEDIKEANNGPVYAHNNEKGK